MYRLIDNATLLQRWVFCSLLVVVHLLLVPVYFKLAGLVAALGFTIISSWIWGMAISMRAGTLISAALIVPHYLILQPLGAFQTTVDLWQLVEAHFILPLVTYGLSTSFHLGRDLARQLQRTEEEQARFRGLFDANNDAVFIFDLNYRIIQANEQAVNMLGYSREELLSMPYQELVVPEDRAARNEKKMGILFFDLDRFKKVNDELGHAMGDLLLQTVAERVQKLLRYADTLFRFGGDEFTLILETIEDRRGAEVLAKKIEHAIEEPFLLEAEYAYIGASVGIAIYPEDGNTADELINFADIEMYSIKHFKKLSSEPTP